MPPWTRRDFIQGVAAATVLGATAQPGNAADLYPPAQTGLRGSHPGSFEWAHALAHGGHADWGPVEWPDDEVYDLVVVGAGLSGLAAAWFFRQERPDARVLIVDNHDDFGGHAKRNEFTVDGQTLLGYGGGQTMEQPEQYSRVAQRLLRALDVDLKRFETAYDQGFFERHGLASGVFFDHATYGEDRLLRCDLARYVTGYLPLARAGVGLEQRVPDMPLSPEARADFSRLLQLRQDRMPGGLLRNSRQLSEMSYLDYLKDVAGVVEPQVLHFWRALLSGDYGYGIDKIRAVEALLMGLPGIHGSSLGRLDGMADRVANHYPPYIHHFPSGLAGLARLLVARLIPELGAQPDRPETLVTRHLDYGLLDRPGSPVRLRLSSPAMHVVEEDGAVAVTTLTGGRAIGVRAKACVLACYNRLIPHICPSLPLAQKTAMSSLVKLPLVYTNVALRNWRAWKDAGVGFVYSPGSHHQTAELDFPVSIGDYHYSEGPEHPVIAHLVRVPLQPGELLVDQLKAGRAELLGTPFETFEAEVLAHLDGMLGAHGLDCERDIAGITVNRWPHGYARSFDSIDDEPFPSGQAPYELGRVPFGRISIANSDAAGRAYADAAIDQGHRAVGEVLDWI